MIGSQSNVIESTAGQVAAELARRGVLPQERVTIMIDREQELIPGRRQTRAHVVAAGLSDGDIDLLIKQTRREVNEDMRREAEKSPQ